MSIRPAFSDWPVLNGHLAAAVAPLSPRELALDAGEGRWPLWAVVGHLACQRVFWLCDVAGLPGAESTPFTNAAWHCPGDDDLENALDAAALVAALGQTFAIVDTALDTWTLGSLSDEIPMPGEDLTYARGAILQRVQAHDLWHAAEVNEILTRHDLPALDPWG